MASTSRTAKVWQEIRPSVYVQKRSITVGLTALLMLGLSQSMLLLLLRGFLKVLFKDEQSSVIQLSDLFPPQVITALGVNGSIDVPYTQLATWVPVAIVAVGAMMSLALYYYQYHQQAISMYVGKVLRERVFAKVLSQNFGEIVRRSPGDWMSVIMNDIIFIQNRISDLLTALLKDVVIIVFNFAALVFIHFPTALVLAVVSPFIAFGMGRTGRRIAHYSERFQRELAMLSGVVLNMRERFEFIRAQRGEARELKWFHVINRAYYDMKRKSILIRSLFAPMLEMFGFVVFAGILLAVGKGYWATMTPAVLLTFFGALGAMLRPLRELGEQLSRLPEAVGAMEQSMRVLQLPDRSEARGDQRENGVRALQIGNLSLSYDGVDPRFQASDIEIAVGKSIAIVGPSGAGKSTFIKNLAGLLPPLHWQASSSYLETITSTSLVSQDPFLFDDSIEANLLYGYRGDKPSRETIMGWLEQLDLQTLINSSPEGLATRARALGANLSGGQIQRLVLARALMRRKNFLLLDEATSAVDPQTEKDISQLVTRLCKEKQIGLIAVTHRLEWLSLYDEIWYVDCGQILMRGPLNQLEKDEQFSRFLNAGGA